MRIKLSVLSAIFVLIIFCEKKVFAQEDIQTQTEIQELNSHPELNLNRDKTLLMEADKPVKNSYSDRDYTSPPANIKKTETTKTATDKNEKNPLSFNFLYFIIEKFKISDIVD